MLEQSSTQHDLTFYSRTLSDFAKFSVTDLESGEPESQHPAQWTFLYPGGDGRNKRVVKTPSRIAQRLGGLAERFVLLCNSRLASCHERYQNLQAENRRGSIDYIRTHHPQLVACREGCPALLLHTIDVSSFAFLWYSYRCLYSRQRPPAS